MQDRMQHVGTTKPRVERVLAVFLCTVTWAVFLCAVTWAVFLCAVTSAVFLGSRLDN